ncbi:MAG: hypothetical protein LBJ00_16090 [Planctomycetaceae bacterium]|nr:hypothetical protein [Planctomycetaceae bacterium]
MEKLNTQAQQREAVVQGRSLSPYRLRYSNKNMIDKSRFLEIPSSFGMS